MRHSVEMNSISPKAVLEKLFSGALFIDESSRGKIEVFGPEAGMFLHNLSTADVAGMPIGAGTEAFFANSKARAVAWGGIYHVLLSQGRGAFWVDIASGQESILLAHLDRHLISEQAEFCDRTEAFNQFHIVGNSARAILENLTEGALPDLEPWQHMERQVGPRAVCHIRYHEPFGFPGYDIVCQSKLGSDIHQLLVVNGAKEVAGENLEWARLGAGTPKWGCEINAETFVSEVGRNSVAVAPNKGCYLGQEPIVMARDRGQISKRLSKLSTIGAFGDLPAILRDGEKEAGVITSAAVHPELGGIALGYVRRNWWQRGANLTANGLEIKVVGPASQE